MRRITEGKVSITVPEQPVTRKAEAFYNPEMEYQRDLTMSALRVFGKGRRLSVCDPLAGTGIRSLRMTKEVPGVERIVANDMSASAFRVMKRNLGKSALEGIDIEIRNDNARDVFRENQRRFDFLDIDPFGSPIGFIEDAAGSLKRKALLACTATDTGALCGAFPRTSLSRYGITTWKTDFFKETGIRVLITSVMMKLHAQGIAFEPLYSHANHYFRVIGIARRDRRKADGERKMIRKLYYCRSCLFRTLKAVRKCPSCSEGLTVIGPLWTGKTIDTRFCRSMLSDLESTGYIKTKELELAVDEIDEPFYYDLHRMFKVMRKTPKRIYDVISCLEHNGFSASRTRFSGTGLMTDAPYEELKKCL